MGEAWLHWARLNPDLVERGVKRHGCFIRSRTCVEVNIVKGRRARSCEPAARRWLYSLPRPRGGAASVL